MKIQLNCKLKNNQTTTGVPAKNGDPAATIESLEPGNYFFQAEWYSPNHLYTPDGPDMKTITSVCNIRDYPLVIKVEDHQITNRGIVLKPMIH